MATILEVRAITKTFPGVTANDNVDLSVEQGEVHCIIGENGAGKSTAMNILYGVLSPDSGEILLRGSPVRFQNPKDAIQHGIGMVHQEFMLVPSLTVLENIILGLEIKKWNLFLDQRAAGEKLESMISKWHLNVPLSERVSQLPIAIQQRVEILKLLFRGADILILDEPTAVLAPQEVDALFESIRVLKRQGNTIIFITHKLREVMELADRITVMRDGRVVGNTVPSAVDERTLAHMMVGRDVLFQLSKAAKEPGETILKISDLWVRDDRGNWAIRGISFEVREREILGIAGVAGNGQRELAETIFGLRKAERGSITLSGKRINSLLPRNLREMKASYVPQDRIATGSAVDTSILKNILMGHHWNPTLVHGPLINAGEVENLANTLLKRYEVKLSDIGSNFSSLSGGNKQKVIVGRELIGRPKFLLSEDPTRGIDVVTTGYVRQTISDEAREGMSVLLISQDLQEVLSMSDRVCVMFEGKLAAERSKGGFSETEIGLLMTGGSPGHERKS